MRNVDDALAEIGSLSGLGKLAFDENGQVELVFRGQWAVAVLRRDDATLELVAELPKLGTRLGREALKQLLTANYLGEATGAGRISLDPRDEVVTYGRRLDVAGLDTAGLQAAFDEFLRFLAFWHTPDAAATLVAHEDDAEPSPAESGLGAFAIRA